MEPGFSYWISTALGDLELTAWGSGLLKLTNCPFLLGIFPQYFLSYSWVLSVISVCRSWERIWHMPLLLFQSSANWPGSAYAAVADHSLQLGPGSLSVQSLTFLQTHQQHHCRPREGLFFSRPIQSSGCTPHGQLKLPASNSDSPQPSWYPHQVSWLLPLPFSWVCVQPVFSSWEYFE